LHRLAQRDLARVPTKHCRSIIAETLALVEEPLPPGARLLEGHRRCFRLGHVDFLPVDPPLVKDKPYVMIRHGEYNVVYHYDNSHVNIVAVGHRSGVRTSLTTQTDRLTNTRGEAGGRVAICGLDVNVVDDQSNADRQTRS